jgi:hypothetical protein
MQEVLSLLRVPGQPTDEVLDEIKRLPNQLAILKAQVTRRFPLMDMRRAEVPLCLA